MKKTFVTFGASAVIAIGGLGGATIIDQTQNPYIDKGTTYELPFHTDLQQNERIEIAKNKAQVTLKGWNDEYSITVTPLIPVASVSQQSSQLQPFQVSANRPLFSDQLQFKAGKVTAFVEPHATSIDKFDIDFTLDSKPDTNIFNYLITGAEDFDFFYQPALNEEFASSTCTPTDCGEEHRPEDVVGSYAIYSKDKSGDCTNCGTANYATGKIAHIYRPKVIDASGNWVWASLNFSNGVLSVTVPQAFLDNATYPVHIDPTFGWAVAGASSTSNSSASIYAYYGSTYTPSGAGTASSISIYSAYSGNPVNIELGIYKNSDNTLLGHTSAISISNSGASPQWNSASFSPTLSITAQQYILSFFIAATTPTQLVWYYDTVAAGVGDNLAKDSTNAYPNWPATNVWSNGKPLTANRRASIYVTYTATAVAAPAQSDFFF